MRVLAASFLLIFCGPIVAGDFSQRFELTLARVLHGKSPAYTDELLLADVIPRHIRRFTNFSGDLSGRYIGAVAAAARHTDRRFASLDRVALEILRHQKPDGHFGDSMSDSGVEADDMARLWGNGRLLIGLLEYHRLNPRPDVLEAARRIGDFLVSVAPVYNSDAVRRQYSGKHFAMGYICWTQNIEGLVELYRVTGSARYRELAQQMAARVARYPSQHSHGFLSSLRGIVELFKATGEETYLEQAEREWKGIGESGSILIQGAVPEAFYPHIRRDDIRRDEGCSHADWVRLGLELWRLTGKLQYLEQAEGSLLNGFSFNQFPNGDFGHHVLEENGIGSSGVRAWWCCTLHGLRAFPDIAAAAFHSKERVVFYDLPIDSRVDADGWKIRADSSLARDGTVRLEVVEADGRIGTLAIRRPGWATAIEASVDGRPVPGEMQNGYLRLDRGWRSGESVQVRYRMETRLVHHAERPNRVALFHGPWLLGVDERMSPQFFGELASQNRVALPASGPGGTVKLGLVPVEENRARPHTAPVARFNLSFLSAGYLLQPANAILRPLAEKTATEPVTRWRFWLPAGPDEGRPALLNQWRRWPWLVIFAVIGSVLVIWIGLRVLRRVSRTS